MSKVCFCTNVQKTSIVDGEDEIVTAGPDISPNPPSTRNLSNSNNSASIKSVDKENVNPNSSWQRREGDGGPASASQSSSDSKDDFIDDSDVFYLNNLEKKVERRLFNVSMKLLDEVEGNVLARTEALYEELNQSRTPELPSNRHRSVVGTSQGNTPLCSLQKVSVTTSLSPNRSPKMDEIHESLDQFEELVHNIQEAASNISQMSQTSIPDTNGPNVLTAPNISGSLIEDEKHTSNRTLQNPLDYECFPEDIKSGDDLVNMSARVIEVQNGTFTEFMELSPKKKRLVNIRPRPFQNDKWKSSSFSLTTENNFGDGQSDMLSHTLPSGSSVDRETLGNLDKETESIIERYKRLKLASTSQNDDTDKDIQNFLNDNVLSDTSAKQSPGGTSPLNEKYLQETPNKIRVRRSKKVSLLFDNQVKLPRVESESDTHSGVTKDDVFKRPRTPPRTTRTASDSDKLINLSPFSTPTRSLQEGNF